MRHTLLLSLLAACAGPTESTQDLPGDQLAPPPVLQMTGDPQLLLGEDNLFTFSGDIAVGEIVYLFRSSSAAVGWCPAYLGGNCLQLDGPASMLGNVTVDQTGYAELTLAPPTWVPENLDVMVQAVVVRGINGVASLPSNTMLTVTTAAVYGCTDANAVNYDPNANIDDGTCQDPVFPSGWMAYDFASDDWKNGCVGGDKYVRPGDYATAPWVGVQLCSDTRYKVFLGQDLLDTFYGIGDGCGSGQDQCEFVGGTFQAFDVDYGTSNDGYFGYLRCAEGDDPVFGTMGGAHWTPSWIECGVSIPVDVTGCTNPVANNYDVAATVDDGTCDFAGVVLNDWTAMDFEFNDGKNGCRGGEKDGKSTNYGVGQYVGVILCSADRYKIVLGDDLGGPFYTIGDGCGSGQDQCEFVGGTHVAYDVDYGTSNDGQPGYVRCAEGDEPTLGTLGGAHWTPSWQECGISIP